MSTLIQSKVPKAKPLKHIVTMTKETFALSLSLFPLSLSLTILVAEFALSRYERDELLIHIT